MAGRVLADHLLIWTNHALFLGTFVGALTQPWRFDKVSDSGGLIGPQAAVVAGQAAYWIGPDHQFYSYVLGGAVTPTPCPLSLAFTENLAAGQADKIVASANSRFEEIRFDYPDAREGFENSRFLSLVVSGVDAGAWSQGQMARTAFLDAGPTDFPVGVDPSGCIFWHERGQSADGAPFAWFIESADQVLDETAITLCRGVWPDLQGQVGPVMLTLFSRREPQGLEISYGPYALAPGAARVDLRASGRFFRVRLAGCSAPTACRLGKPIFDVAQAGLR